MNRYDAGSAMSETSKIKIVVTSIIFLVIIVGIIALWPFGQIEAGERGVVLRFGAVTGEIKEEGLYIVNPFTERVAVMDVKLQKSEVDSAAASRDLQSVAAKVALNYHLSPDSVDKIYQDMRTDYNARLIAPALQESVKAATAKFTAEELITLRADVRDQIKIVLKEKLEGRGIIIDDFNIINFGFSKGFDDAIEKKETEKQAAMAEKNKLERIKFEAEQKVAQARGEAESVQIRAAAEAEAIQKKSQALAESPKLVEYEKALRWDGKLPSTIVGGNTIPFFNIN